MIGATTFNHDICNPGTARKSDPHASQTFFSTPISTIVQSLRGHARRFSGFRSGLEVTDMPRARDGRVSAWSLQGGQLPPLRPCWRRMARRRWQRPPVASAARLPLCQAQRRIDGRGPTTPRLTPATHQGARSLVPRSLTVAVTTATSNYHPTERPICGKAKSPP